MKQNESVEFIRQPVVAGPRGFYPSDPTRLRLEIDDYINAAEPKDLGKPMGLISPHAGYVYSGPVAGWAYRQVQGLSYDAVVVLSPSHREPIPFASALCDGAYNTPLGILPVDMNLAKELVNASDGAVECSRLGHLNRGWGASEHALEVQLPFLQVALTGGFKLVPVVVGDTRWEACRRLGEGLAKLLAAHDVLVVASSDLSHYHSYSEAYRLDEQVIAAVKAGKAREVAEGCLSRRFEACGGGAVAALLAAGEALGGVEVCILKHATSGDVPFGSRDQVVGYMAAALYRM